MRNICCAFIVLKSIILYRAGFVFKRFPFPADKTTSRKWPMFVNFCLLSTKLILILDNFTILENYKILLYENFPSSKNIGKEIPELIKMAVILRSHFCRISPKHDQLCNSLVQWAITSQFWPVNKILLAVSLHGAEVTGSIIRVWSLVEEKIKFCWRFSP